MKRVESFRKQFRWALLAGDLILVPLMYYLSYWLRSKTSFLLFDDVIPPDRYFWISHFLWFLVAAHIIFVYFHGLYDRLITYTTNQIIFRSIRAVTLELLVFVAFYFFRLDVAFPRSIIILLWFFIVGSTAIWRVFLVRLYQGRVPQRNLLIVGTTSAAETLLKEIERLPSYRLKVIGILTQTNDTLKTDKFCGYPVLGNRNDILQIVEQYNIHEVVIASEETWQDSLIDQISRIDHIPARICIIPSCYEILIGKINHLRLYDIPLIELIKHPETPIGKRIGDFLIALILFVIFSPIMLMTALIIRFTCGKPVLFQQTRIGKNRKPFTIYKFRTLIPNAEESTGPVLSDDSDQRVTRVGKFLRKYRIDELPQLINIIKGEMSFVGPRPERPFFVKDYIDRIPGYGERFKSAPGLTGLAQVNGGYATTPENKLKYDLTYIYNQSFWLDMRIILETIKVILTGQVNP